MAQHPVPSKVTLTWEPPAYKPLTDVPFKWARSWWVSWGKEGASGSYRGWHCGAMWCVWAGGEDADGDFWLAVGCGESLTGVRVAPVSFPAHLFSQSRQWRGRVEDYFSLLLSHISSRDISKSPQLWSHYALMATSELQLEEIATCIFLIIVY